MRKAAEQLYISQPTVSQAIAELENYYGVKLFERLSQKIYITESGIQLLDYARHIVSLYEDMDLAMKHAGSKPTLRIGGSVSVGTRFFESLARQMEEKVPELDMRMVIHNTEHIETLITKSKLDAGIVEGIIQDRNIVRVPIYKDELVIVVGTSHPFYKRECIALEELDGQCYIAREDGSVFRNQYEKLLTERNIKMVQKWSSSNTEPIKKAVISGKGLAIMSRLIIEKELREGSLRVVPVNGINVRREINLIYHKDKFISPHMAIFMDLAKQLT